MTQSTNNNREQWLRKLLVDFHSPNTTPHIWWYNPINPASLRLTRNGYNWIKKYTTIPTYRVDIQDRILPKQLLQLERLLASPYMLLRYDRIELLDETTAVMLQLHAGDLNTYLQNLEDTQ